jgi:hypothetical protein
MHEYIFGMAIGRVQGYQTAFFLLQGVAVAATARVKAKGLEGRTVDGGNARLQFHLVGVVLREHERTCAFLLTWLAGLAGGLVACKGEGRS